MRRPGVRAEVERIEREEGAPLDALLKAGQNAGLTQAQVAERIGTHAPAVARLERAFGDRQTFAFDCHGAALCEGLWQAAGALRYLTYFKSPMARAVDGFTQ